MDATYLHAPERRRESEERRRDIKNVAMSSPARENDGNGMGSNVRKEHGDDLRKVERG